MKLLVFGPGYSAGAVIARLQVQPELERVVATVRSENRVSGLDSRGIVAVPFDDHGALEAAVAEATLILVSIPPGDDGDPVLQAVGDKIASAPRLRGLVYFSTVGVYGDHGGAWVDEDTEPQPVSERSKARLAAENAWRELGERAGKPVAILRLAGIYGPGRNAFVNLRSGTARRIVKPDQVFNRINVHDIATATLAAFRRRFSGIVNVTDDEPAPPQDVVAYAAELARVDPPPEIPLDEADLSPMARSFYGENKRVANKRLKSDLGVELAFPTYREGLAALRPIGDDED